MNQTKQEAAEAYSKSLEIDRVRFSSGEIEAMREEAKKDFIAGAEWGEPKWIPVTERLPEDNGRYFCVTADDTWIVGEYEHNYIFCDPSGCSWRCKLWCPIPDSLLNFKL